MNESNGPLSTCSTFVTTVFGSRRRVAVVGAASALTGALALGAPMAVADDADSASADPTAQRLLSAEPVEIRVGDEVAEGLPQGNAATDVLSQSDRLGAAVLRDVLSQTQQDFAGNHFDSLAAINDEDRQVVVDIQDSGKGWAEGVAFISAPTDEHGGGEGWLYMAAYEEGAWTVGLEGDAEFAEQVSASPLLDEKEREVFEGYVADRSNQPQDYTGLQLPFPTGTSQLLSGGPHGWSGYDRPFSAVDIYGGNGDVRAARSGTARSICNGWTRIIHDNGYSTDYYHLRNFQWRSGWVPTNAYLGEHGMTLCAGGSANGPHVHFAIRRYDANLNGWYVPLNGNRIGGWWFWEGASAYYGYAYNTSHGYAYPGNWMYNFGI